VPYGAHKTQKSAAASLEENFGHLLPFNPLRPGQLFFEFVVGTCIKRLLLGANKQI
jgi:hypothetical protein